MKDGNQIYMKHKMNKANVEIKQKCTLENKA